jgi:hypothetical protein
MAIYTSAFTGAQIDEILAAVGTVATTQANIDTDLDTVITKLNNILTASTNFDTETDTVISKLTDVITALGNVKTTLVPDPVETIYNASVAGSTSITNIAAVDTSTVKKLWVFCTQTASDSVTIQAFSKSTATSTDDDLLQPITLSLTKLNGSFYFVELPPFVKFTITNNTSTATTVTIAIAKTR